MSEHQVLDHVDHYLNLGVEYDASDIHLSTAFPPSWRVSGVLRPIWEDHFELSKDDVWGLMNTYMSAKELQILDEKGDVDFAYANDASRYRVSVVKQRLGYDMIFRLIKTKIRQMDELKLPADTLIPLLKYQNGLILVTGSVGSGKSTSMAAMIDYINADRQDHILTLEDPIEFVYECKGCHISQREIENHTESFARALRGALRQDPDIIVVGEMRDLETIQLAVTAAETGHLVFGTLHTGNAPRTLDRLLDVFPTDQREQIRIMVAESLRGIISQQLIPTKDGKGRIATHEILVNTSAVASLIREGKTYMLPGVMQVGKSVGMSRMDDALVDRALEGVIAKDEAIRRAEDQKEVTRLLADLPDEPAS